MRFLFPLLLIALGVYGLVERDMLNDEWAAMYPEDPAQQTALAHCTQDNVLFNRFSAAARAACYQKYLQLAAPAPGHAIGVQITNTPTHVVPHAPMLHTNH
jgi:hypothetical protein